MSAVLLAVPVVVGSAVVMALVGRLAWPEQAWIVPVAWGLCGGVMFVPSVENLLGWVMFDMRRPTPAELRKLEPSWQAVCEAAGIDGGRYLLWIEHSRALNAFAAGGRMVAVTKPALTLPERYLEAILAHELGHHLSGHARISLLRWWYELPARATILLARLLALVVVSVARFFVPFGRVVAVLASVLLTLGLLTGLAFLNPWLLVIPLLSPVLAWSRRLGEYEADRTAARLGYGQVLVQVLSAWLAESGGDRRRWRDRVFASHPAHIDRIKRLRELLSR